MLEGQKEQILHVALRWRLFEVTLSTGIQSRVHCCRLLALQVIAPEEIVDPDVDEHSVMTYLSQFPKAKLKPGAPLRPKQLFPNKVKAYGPGGERDTEIPNSRRSSQRVMVSPRRLSLQVLSLTATRCCSRPCSLWTRWKLAAAKSSSMWRIPKATRRRYPRHQ